MPKKKEQDPDALHSPPRYSPARETRAAMRELAEVKTLEELTQTEGYWTPPHWRPRCPA